MNAKEKLIIALDVDTMEEVEKYVKLLKDEVGMFKIGLQVYTSLGNDVVKKVKNAGGKIFLDLKLHDIPNTVGETVRVLTGLGVDIMNVHASGGKSMMNAAAVAAKEEAARLGIEKPKVIAVTILTSLGEEDTREIGYMDKPEDMVKRLAALAKEAGLDGVVCSPLEAKIVKDTCGSEFASITPGVRPASASKGDQKRVMTPKDAIANGAHYLVVGRPIMKADDPVQAAREIVKEMEEALC